MDYETWCALSDDELADRDIGEINLACALGLRGSEGLDTPACLRKLDQWAEAVRQGTRKFQHHFIEHPEEFEHSLAQFRIGAMITVLQLELGVHYNPACMEGPYDARDSRNHFIHGLLTGYGGTCVSMPVLYVAIGRRLGYPLKLMYAKAHVLVRWDDPSGERFPVEATQHGYARHNDEYYHNWPTPLTPEEFKSGYFLRSLTARQELALFVGERGRVLLDNLETGRAIEALQHAYDLDHYQKSPWAIGSVVWDIMNNLAAGGLRKNLPLPELIELATPSAYVERFGQWGEAVTREGKRHALRILALNRQRFIKTTTSSVHTTPKSEDLWFTIQS